MRLARLGGTLPKAVGPALSGQRFQMDVLTAAHVSDGFQTFGSPAGLGSSVTLFPVSRMG